MTRTQINMRKARRLYTIAVACLALCVLLLALNGCAVREKREVLPDPYPQNRFLRARITSLAELEPHEYIAYSGSDLASALSEPNGITTVYLGSDITLTGFVVHSSKTDIVIDGINPLDSTATVHTLTEINSASQADVIQISNTANLSATLRNMKILARNYYGTVTLRTAHYFTHVYDHVVYNGPQSAYNRYGLTVYKDSQMFIHSDNGGSDAGEIGEVMDVDFAGKCYFEHNNPNRLFWLPSASGNITVRSGADIDIISNNQSLFYGNPIKKFLMEQDASMRISTPRTFNENDLNAFEMMEGARLIVENRTNPGLPILRVTGNMTLHENAYFHFETQQTSANAVVRVQGDLETRPGATFHVISLSGSGACVALFGAGRTANFIDPASVVLYNQNNRPIYFETLGTLKFNAQQVNYWNTALPYLQAGGFDDRPLYHWLKTDGSEMQFSGTVSGGDAGVFTSLSTNHTEDDPEPSPTPQNFNLASARILAFGRPYLDTHAIGNTHTRIRGNASSEADLRLRYLQYPDTEGRSDALGMFNIPISYPLIPDTLMTIELHVNFLYTEQTIRIEIYSIEFLNVSDTISFGNKMLSAKPQQIESTDLAIEVAVNDRRGEGLAWALYLKLTRPLSTQTPDGTHILEDAVFYRDGQGNEFLLDETPILVFQAVSQSNNEQTVLTWEDGSGIFLKIAPGAYARTYTAGIEWELVDLNPQLPLSNQI